MAKRRILWKKFAADLRRTRKRVANGYSMRHVAKALKIDKATWSRAENARPIDTLTFVWLADWCGQDPRMYLAHYNPSRRRPTAGGG